MAKPRKKETYMSKKLIAVASAVALSLAGFAGLPASASVTVTPTAADFDVVVPVSDGTAANPYVELVPHANVLTADNTIEFKVAAAVGTDVTVKTTGAVRVIDALTGVVAGTQYNAASGLTTWTEEAIAAGAGVGIAGVTFYIYSTSTTAGTFQVSTKTATSSATGSAIYVKGAVGPAYNMSVVAPATMATGVASEILFTATDAFGNAIETAAGAYTVNTFVNGAPVAGVVSAWNSTKKANVVSITPADGNPIAVHAVLATAAASLDVAGLPKSKKSFFTVINGAGSSDLAAKVAELQKIVDRKVTKKRFNTLAKKWNAAFPSQAVKLKK